MFELAIVVGLLLIILLTGLPVAFGLGLTAVILALINGIPLSFVGITVLESLNSTTLMAVPLFIFMSQVLLIGRVGDQLFETVNTWVRHLPGGLSVATVLSCAVFAAITGSGAATAATIGTVAYPAMVRRSYDQKFTLGLLACGGTLGILIPPSIPMILYSSITDASLDRLFIAGVIPGLLLTLLLSAYAVWRSRHGAFEPMPKADWPERIRLTLRNLPGLLLPVLVIGGIYAGIFTPTEAAAVGLVYSLFITMVLYRSLSIRQIPKVCLEGLTTSCMIGMIIIGAHFFGKIMTILGIPQQLTALVVEHNFSPLMFILAINLVLLLLGAILETVSVVLLTTPLVLPIMLTLNIDPIWYGVVLTVNMAIALITPPVGMDLYVIKSLRDDITLGMVIRGVTPFIMIMAFFLALIILFPSLTTWLPSLMPVRGSGLVM
ncbi:MAG: TRAP transporter large permease [Desulfobulbaceae bacterium]|nr:TRAP transporter large permease [Desulfobulbaceae bacterium]